MFGQPPSYNGYLRKYIVLFGTLFNDISIARIRDDTTVQTVKIPITYGSQDKLLARDNADPLLDRPVAAISPAMAFEHTAPYYDTARKLQSALTRCVHTVNGVQTQFVGVPYNIDFSLYIYSKDEEDGLKILEDIIYNFTPSMTVTANIVDGSDYKVDIPIVLNSVDFQNNSYGSFEERRSLIWTLKFTMKAEFGGPLSGIRKLIKIVTIPIRDKTTQATMEEVYAQPGLTANGQPTTNITQSVDPHTINSTDNWGYVVEILDSNTSNNVVTSTDSGTVLTILQDI